MSKPAKHAFFIIKRTLLAKLIRQLAAGITNKKYREGQPCELTLVNGFVSFNVPGATFGEDVESSGTAKASFDLTMLKGIIATYRQPNLKVTIQEGTVFVEKFGFSAHTTFFDDDKILRTLILPINYSDIDLISIYASKKYTDEELMFNKLWIPVLQAEGRLRNNVNAAVRHLGPYGITKEDVIGLLNAKIKVNVHSLNKSYNFQMEKQTRKK